MKRSIFSGIVLAIVCIFTVQLPVFAAQADCKPLYGGGVTKEQTCTQQKSASKPTPTPGKTKPTPTKAATTKGGLPVHSPAPATATPSTGPEALGIIALAPAMALGYYLRKKQ